MFLDFAVEAINRFLLAKESFVLALVHLYQFLQLKLIEGVFVGRNVGHWIAVLISDAQDRIVKAVRNAAANRAIEIR